MNNCPICNSSKIIKIGFLTGSRTGKKHPLYACRNCYSLFQRPSYHEDKKALRDDLEWHINKKEVYKISSKVIIKKLLEINPTSKTMLDIGCGIGTTLLEGKKLGLSCSGIEPNLFACKYAKQHYNLDIIEDYFRPEHFTDSFDLIILDQVLEHVPQPQQFMKGVFSVLKPSGLVYLSVPGNKGGIIRVLFSLLFQRSKKSIFRDNDVHINHFFHKGILHLSYENRTHVLRKVNSGSYIIQKNDVGL